MTSEALVWARPEVSLDRHNKPEAPPVMNHYGFRGWPDQNFHRPKQPVVAPPSADVQDVSHFFRKDSATQRYTPPEHQPPPSPMKQSQDPPAWLQSHRASPPPQQHLEPASHLPPTLSPRYEKNAEPLRPSDSPVIRDPHGQLSSADIKKKAMEAQVARENYDEDLRRKEALKEAKRDEQRKRFQPIQYDEGRGRSPMRERPDSINYNRDRKEDLDRAVTMPLVGPQSERYKTRDDLRKTEQAIIDLRRKIHELEQKQESNNTWRGDTTNRGANDNLGDNNKIKNISEGLRVIDRNALARMLEDQERDIGRLQSEINKLREQRAMESYREPPPYGATIRAQSEPLTDRPYRHHGGLMPEDYLGATPRRRPVGDLFQTNSTYMSDFDTPFNRPGGRRNLGNPNLEGPFQTYWPFQRAGAGAPLVNRQGQRYTQIQGTMDRIGREQSDSARARKIRNSDMLETLKRQKEDDKIKKMLDKERQQQGYVELAADMRTKKVGMPRYQPNGYIGQHHLPHTMSNPHERPDFDRMRNYREALDEQTAQKQKDTRLAQLEAVQQARKHQQTLDAKFGPRIPGGGNRKGPDLRKVNLENALHQPRSNNRYYEKVRIDEDDGEGVLTKFKPRVTVNSSHKNLYEFPEGNLKNTYVGGAPYAENPSF